MWIKIPELKAALFSAVNLSFLELEDSSDFFTRSGLFFIASSIDEITSPFDFSSSEILIL